MIEIAEKIVERIRSGELTGIESKGDPEFGGASPQAVNRAIREELGMSIFDPKLTESRRAVLAKVKELL